MMATNIVNLILKKGVTTATCMPYTSLVFERPIGLIEIKADV